MENTACNLIQRKKRKMDDDLFPGDPPPRKKFREDNTIEIIDDFPPPSENSEQSVNDASIVVEKEISGKKEVEVGKTGNSRESADDKNDDDEITIVGVVPPKNIIELNRSAIMKWKKRVNRSRFIRVLPNLFMGIGNLNVGYRPRIKRFVVIDGSNVAIS